MCAPRLSPHQSEKEVAVPDESGTVWTGQLLDANGRQGSVTAHFVAEKGLAAWKLALVERDGPSTELEGEAPLEGRDPREGVRLKSSDELAAGGVVNWELELTPADAGLFAQSALVGSYSVAAEGTDLPLPLTRGVMVIWLFE
jgi:hypothetical protein